MRCVTTIAWGLLLSGLVAAPAGGAGVPATVERSVTVQGDPGAVWARIGPACAIADWHPVFRAYVLDGVVEQPGVTRLLTARDAVRPEVSETLTAVTATSYSYRQVRGPLAGHGYEGTFSAAPGPQPGTTVVAWRATFDPSGFPDRGTAAAARLGATYQAGLDHLRPLLGTVESGEPAATRRQSP